MSWRTELKNAVMGAIGNALGEQLKYIDSWNSQSKNHKDEETRAELGVYFEYVEIGRGLEYFLRTNARSSEKRPVLVRIHVLFNDFSNNSQDIAYDYADIITNALSGLKHRFIIGRISNVSEREDTSHKAMYEYQMDFAFYAKQDVITQEYEDRILGMNVEGTIV